MIWLTIIGAIALILALVVISRRSRDNTRETETREIQIAKLRQRANQLEQLIHSWRRLSNNRVIPQELYQVELEILDRISVIDAGHSFAANEQQRLLPQIEDLSSGTAQHHCQTALGSTGELARLQNELKEIKRILRARTGSELLSNAHYEQFSTEIDWLGNRVALDTYLSLAQDAVHNNQPQRGSELVQQALSVIESLDSANPKVAAYLQSTTALQQKLPPRAAGGN